MSICAKFIVAIWLLGTVAAAPATPSPASVTSCAVVPETMSRRGTTPEKIRVSFEILSTTPADLARFTATAPAGALEAFTVRGTFTKGAMIADRLVEADPSAPVHPLASGVECMLTYVHFVNGSSWSAPSQ
jgi:hypothetical protein